MSDSTSASTAAPAPSAPSAPSASPSPSAPVAAPSAATPAPDTANPEAPASPAAALTGGYGLSRRWALASLLLATFGAVGALLLWQKISHVQEELARRSSDTGTQAIEARTLAREAQQGTRELAARLAATETRLSEVSLQRTQLEELMRSLSRSRDDNLVVDMDAGLRLAQQQAQLTGSAEPLLAALKSAEQRLQRAAQPRLTPVQRAIAKDTERVKSAVLTDVPALLLKLDELVRQVDDLPVANAVATSAAAASQAPAATPAAAGGALSGAALPATPAFSLARFFDAQSLRDWSARAWQGLRDEARSLLRVSRIDQPEAALLAPEQSYFLRENLKLKLLNVRLALLSRQNSLARTDLANVQAILLRYFDTSSRRTQVATDLLQQVQAQLRSGELPRLDETLAALATAAAGR